MSPIIELVNPNDSGHCNCNACGEPVSKCLRIGSKMGKHSQATIIALCLSCIKKLHKVTAIYFPKII